MASTVKNIAAALAFIAVGAAGGWMFSRFGHSPPPPAASAATAERKPLYWYDPMVPGQKFDKPGKSPFMDMQLVPLGAVATISLTDGPPMLKSENARPAGWVYIAVRGRDLAAVAQDLRAAVTRDLRPEPGISLSYAGQFEYLQRANARLTLVVPATLLIIFVLLVMIFGRFDEALLILATLPFALIGGVWLLYFLGHALSVATGVGFIALAGLAAEFGVVMLLCLKQSLEARQAAEESPTREGVDAAIREGAVLRVRPKAMTVAVILAGLLPTSCGARALK